jgi:hypothetical protein
MAHASQRRNLPGIFCIQAFAMAQQSYRTKWKAAQALHGQFWKGYEKLSGDQSGEG